jgi:thiopurine S-methyltransferase
MDREFWQARWRDGQIGFHEGKANAMLVAHQDRLPSGRVLVPLCGKAEDLAYLAGLGHEVVGIELAEQAVRAFFAEHQLVPMEGRAGPFLRLSAGGVTLLCGDIFAATPELVGPVSCFYDRAAVIALPPELRGRYLAKLRELAPGRPGLVITVLYDAGGGGPPFEVPDAEVLAAFPRAQLLAEHQTTIGSKALPGTERVFFV